MGGDGERGGSTGVGGVGGGEEEGVVFAVRGGGGSRGEEGVEVGGRVDEEGEGCVELDVALRSGGGGGVEEECGRVDEGCGGWK